MTLYEAWQIVSKMIDRTYTNQDYDDAIELIDRLIRRTIEENSLRRM